MEPAAQDIDIVRGDVFNFFFRVRERGVNGILLDYEDLTGWTGIAQARANYDTAEVLAEFAVTIANQSDYPGGVLVSLTPAQTSVLTFTGATKKAVIGVWDIQLTNSLGEPNTYIAGNVTLIKDVSHA